MPTIPALLSLSLLVIFALVIFIAYQRIKKDQAPQLRPIATFDQLRKTTAAGIEANQPIHFSLGTGHLTDKTTADTLAGLAVLDYVADQTTAANANLIVTMADPITMLMAQDRLRQASRANQQAENQTVHQVHWISPEPTAYASGVMATLSNQQPTSNLMVGHFGDEYLLMGEAAHQQPQPVITVAGASNPNIIPYIYATSPEGLWGEELFAGGAYLQKKPFHISSLLAQDFVRWLVALAILGSILFNTFTGTG